MPSLLSAPVIPSLETERLLLRGHRPEDLEPGFQLWSSPEVTQYIGGKPFTREEVWARLLRYVGHWAVLGFGYWVVQEKQTGRFVGEVGLADFKRDLQPSLDGAPEMGWALLPSAQGKGLATEAVQGILAWSEANLPCKRTVCLIDPSNAASLRVAQKCGYQVYAQTTYKGGPTLVLERN